VTQIGALSGAEIVWKPQINQGLVRFLDPRETATEEDHDRFTDAVMTAILSTGDAFFTGTTWRGRKAMRVSVCNWQTTSEEVDAVCRSIAKVLSNARMMRGRLFRS